MFEPGNAPPIPAHHNRPYTHARAVTLYYCCCCFCCCCLPSHVCCPSQQLERGASGEVSGDASDPLGLGYGGDEDGGGGHSDGLGADGGERRSVNGTTQPPKNPWAPLPGPCPKALLHLHARQVQQTQRALTTVDSMRLARQGHA